MQCIIILTVVGIDLASTNQEYSYVCKCNHGEKKLFLSRRLNRAWQIVVFERTIQTCWRKLVILTMSVQVFYKANTFLV